MTYGCSILEDLRLAEDAGMVFPEAEKVLEEEVTAANDGLKELTVPELRERGLALGVVPAGTDREKRLPGTWVTVTATALGVARAAARPELAAATAAAAAAAPPTTTTTTTTTRCRCLQPRLDQITPVLLKKR
jgi:hypothetical protein